MEREQPLWLPNRRGDRDVFDMNSPCFTQSSSTRPQRSLLVVAILMAISVIATPARANDSPEPQGSDNVIAIASRSFDIPFHVNGNSTASSVKLYVSVDKGESWQIASESPLPVEKLHFDATEDGEHWFAHQMASPETPTPEQLTAERKILIDTTGPTIRLDGEADLDGGLQVQMTLDDSRELGSLRILYATDVYRQWITVDSQSVDSEGRFEVRPDHAWKQVVLHVTAMDALGNVSVESKSFRKPRIATLPTKGLAGTGMPQVHAAAGPSDPPNLHIGPPRFESAPTPQSGYGQANQPAQQWSADVPFGLQRFGLRGTTDQRTRPLDTPQSRMSPIDGASSTPQSANNDQVAQLPASGLEARLTQGGVEVLPAPSAEQDPEAASDAPVLEGPSTAAPADAAAPVNTPVDLPRQDRPMSSQQSPSYSEQKKTLDQALNPINSSRPDAADSSNSPLEIVPTPKPTTVMSDQRRHRVERAELEGKKLQREFDLAQLNHTVPYRFSDSNRFSLEYELEAVGSTGVESVELYGSLDGGGTWQRWGSDPDRTSPFDIETNGEGLFSFRIVVLGNNGLASPRPLPGDTPDIAVLVDQSPPQTRITSAKYGEGDRIGSLVIQYECNDANLTTRPIALAFSDSLAGPWTTIAAGLQNNGVYVWPADPKLPGQIYLRIDATDKAGNTGSYLLDQPIQTSGLAPRAKILGFRSR
ncbi:hypothetical protein CGZ80_22940 [Rhodopirellula sp. MGV]|nr:hypothetical protein CGZ80_22940 [Rhodopirellula sp. MGV]PNY34697.1 hypothetical protein C2E31_22290 [Rhodopirellula baltica]